MKIYFRKILLMLSVVLFNSCEDVIQIEGVKVEPVLVVEAMISNQTGEQVIKLTKSQNYFDNSIPLTVQNAVVTVQDDLGIIYNFKDFKNNGNYVWKPQNHTDIMGIVGRKYTLRIISEGETYQAVTELKRVPIIDSILYQISKKGFNNQASTDTLKEYEPQFYANDIKGIGDCYLIKSFKNEKLLGNVSNFSLGYDSGFNRGDGADGSMFISYVRRSIAREVFHENDIVRVELYSITENHYDFWLKAQEQIRNGGLFATPPAYITTNIFNVNKLSSKKAEGWFATVGVSILETKIIKNNARTNLK